LHHELRNELRLVDLTPPCQQDLDPAKQRDPPLLQQAPEHVGVILDQHHAKGSALLPRGTLVLVETNDRLVPQALEESLFACTRSCEESWRGWKHNPHHRHASEAQLQNE